MKKYTNWTFTSPLLDDYRAYRPWHCVLSRPIQTRNVMLVDTVRTLPTDGHDCRYYSTIHVGLRRTKTPWTDVVCVQSLQWSVAAGPNSPRDATESLTPKGLERFPAIPLLSSATNLSVTTHQAPLIPHGVKQPSTPCTLAATVLPTLSCSRAVRSY